MQALYAQLPTAPFGLASAGIYQCNSVTSSGDQNFEDLLTELMHADGALSSVTENPFPPLEQDSIMPTLNLNSQDDIQRTWVTDVSQAAIVTKPDEAASLKLGTNQPQLLIESSFQNSCAPQEPSQPAFSPISSEESSSVSEGVAAMEATSISLMDLDKKVDRLKHILERYEKIVQANGSNGKFQVHQVVHLLLLATVNPEVVGIDLDNVLVFCDEGGSPSTKSRRHFRAQDTRTMGLVWQKIKGNKNCNYDTFARAMRVGRERSKQYFEYLESGKGSKKRVYKLGEKSISEMRRMEELLPQICAL